MQGPPPLRIGRRTVRAALWLPLLGGLALALVAGLVFVAAGSSSQDRPPTQALSGQQDPITAPLVTESSGSPAPSAGAAGPLLASVLRPDGLYFGVSTPKAPDAAETEAVAEAAGQRPTVQEVFVKWNEEFSAATVRNSYKLGAVPLITWEPWSGSAGGLDQPDYALRTITKGRHDAYVRRFAQAVKAQGQPIILRFAHEMNGTWYPWSEQRSGNEAGDYVAAWRHVHDVFQQLGVTNVIWLWCPNIERGTPQVGLARYYPGDRYVDWLGLDAYEKGEKSADEVLDSSYRELLALSDKPVFIGETGAEPGSHQAAWTADFFRWLASRPRVIGFIWFQHSAQEGGSYDWRFTTAVETEQAFRGGLASARLVPWPVSDRPA